MYALDDSLKVLAEKYPQHLIRSADIIAQGFLSQLSDPTIDGFSHVASTIKTIEMNPDILRTVRQAGFNIGLAFRSFKEIATQNPADARNYGEQPLVLFASGTSYHVRTFYYRKKALRGHPVDIAVEHFTAPLFREHHISVRKLKQDVANSVRLLADIAQHAAQHSERARALNYFRKCAKHLTPKSNPPIPKRQGPITKHFRSRLINPDSGFYFASKLGHGE